MKYYWKSQVSFKNQLVTNRRISVHAYNRVISGEKLFRDSSDYQIVKNMIPGLLEKLKLNCDAWCLMPNHYHFLLTGYRRDFSQFFFKIFNFYCKYYNLKYARSGHLMGGRVNYRRIFDEDQYLAVINYIAGNPEESGLETDWPYLYCKSPADNRAELSDCS